MTAASLAGKISCSRFSWAANSFPFMASSLQPAQQRAELAEVAPLHALANGVLAAGGGQNEDVRAVQLLFLQAEFAFALREFLVDDLAVKGQHSRRVFRELLRQQDAPFGKFLPPDL